MNIKSYHEFINENQGAALSPQNGPGIQTCIPPFKSEDPDCARIAKFGLNVLSQIRIFHWQTTVGDLHKTLGNFYDALDENTDKLVECMMGKYGRFSIKDGSMSTITDYSDSALENLISMAESVYGIEARRMFVKDSEICNILDEILAEIQKLKYLKTLS
jgi:hypothetical protein